MSSRCFMYDISSSTTTTTTRTTTTTAQENHYSQYKNKNNINININYIYSKSGITLKTPETSIHNKRPDPTPYMSYYLHCDFLPALPDIRYV
ncbi:GL12315 [Drosophila persimilis]|uniref:GL12315 n=1 Tax=Drosophila persimilis TaxID=7234 RepID=B4GM58_DROPE|nr:GL12315 [Drosophila persimilis]